MINIIHSFALGYVSLVERIYLATKFSSDISKNRTDRSRANALHISCGGTRFESRPRHWLS
jgi:hypothetical protein